MAASKDSQSPVMKDKPSLAIDIGTRKVIGLLTEETPKGLKIVAAERMEHRTRAMFDGQVHDVGEVARVVKLIKERLQAKAKMSLTEAAVAAAGRALRTYRSSARVELSPTEEINRGQVLALELDAVQEAQRALAQGRESAWEARDYHYVGHSVIRYYLDGIPMTNLVGQHGSQATVDIIATFLPRLVVDSMLSVLDRAGLEMTGLTLEPIAAINVIIPNNMRHLNLALVDVGAGTSDIAITEGGAVVAYDMVPIAGDEFTERISEGVLADFDTAETIKRTLAGREKVTFTDILGNRRDVDASDINASLETVLREWAREVADRIISLNSRPPQAVFCVGGGSLTPGLPRALAAALGLDPARVAARGRDAIAGVFGGKGVLEGPEAVTPIGIAVSAGDMSNLGFAYVHVNQRGVRLFNPGRLKVRDALLAAGISAKDLHGKPGRGLTVAVNGRLKLIPGTFGRPASILLNEEATVLDSPIKHRDRITMIPGTDGNPGQGIVADAVPSDLTLRLRWDGIPVVVPPIVTVNGEEASLDQPLEDNSTVTVRKAGTLREAVRLLNKPGGDGGEAAPSSAPAGTWGTSGTKEIMVFLNGQARTLPSITRRFRVNGVPAEPAALVSDDDSVVTEGDEKPCLRDLIGPDTGGGLRVKVNGKVLDLGIRTMTVNGQPVQLDRRLDDGDRIQVTGTDSSCGMIFTDLFRYVDFDPMPPTGSSRLVTTRNGAPADFTARLHDGDEIIIRWEQG